MKNVPENMLKQLKQSTKNKFSQKLLALKLLKYFNFDIIKK